MEHIGIDLGASQSHVVVLYGEQLVRSRVATPELPGWLCRRPPGRVVMEACTQSQAIARAAIAAGHQTFVVPGHLVRALGVGARGIKTDDRDAEALARASLYNPQLPSVHLRSEPSRSRSELLSARATLVEARKSISNLLKSWLRGRLIRLKGVAINKSFVDAVRKIALEHAEGVPLATQTLLDSFSALADQIARLDEEISQVAEQDAACAKLMRICGVGPIVSLAFVSRVDDPKRFGSAEHLASFLALAPGEATTGGKKVRTGTIKAGPSYLKALLVQAAWSMWRCRPNDPAVLWAHTIADKRGKRIAIVALARKLATIMWSIWKNDCEYDPSRASSFRSATT